LGDGAQTSFWTDSWLGSVPLCEKFPRLFSISLQKKASVANLWSPNADHGWNFVWRRNLFVWETTLLEELLLFLRPVVLSTGKDDWGWRPEQGGEFSVKSAYVLVSNLLIERRNFSLDQQLAFKFIWKCPAPSKMLGLVWMVLHDKVPTRVNLVRRGVIPGNGDQACALCGEGAESVEHLFLYCKVIMQVWERILVWLGLQFMLPHNILSLLIYVATILGCKPLRRGLIMIWCSVIWIVWRHRNRIIFENGIVDGAGLLEEIKVASWKWWIGRGSSSPCLYYEWVSELELCMRKR
jgi:hypothetical protein